MQSLVLIRIDDCNVAFAHLATAQYHSGSGGHQVTARLVLRLKLIDHGTTAIQNELQWLMRIGERIKFKL